MPSHQGVNAAIPPSAAGPYPVPRLLLVSLAATDSAALVTAVAQRLAPLTGLPVRAILQAATPAEALSALISPAGAWLAPLPVDVGVVQQQGSWAEALGAWRQPTLLVVEAQQRTTGLPAAATALLRHWQVPLVGLLAWSAAATAQPASEHPDGLPWLGSLGDEPAADADGDQELLLALKAGWREQISRLA
jgi:hypothetical protein